MISELFFSIWVFFHVHSRFTGQQGKGLLSTTSIRLTDTKTLAGRSLQRTHLSIWLVAGLEPETYGFRAQVTNHEVMLPKLKQKLNYTFW